jgi:uncharacterized protein YjbI with pentapeptide repeats
MFLPPKTPTSRKGKRHDRPIGILLALCILLCLLLTGFSMNPFLTAQIRESMSRPLEFNQKLGSKPHTLFMSDFPKGEAKGLRFDGWKFNRVTFESVEWEDITFTNCSFSNCTFRFGKIKKSHFINTPLHDVKFVGAEAESLTFDGGEWSGIGFVRSEGYDPDLRHITLKNLTWHKSEVHRTIGDHWDVIGCRIENNDFKEMKLYYSRFEKTLFQKNNMWNTQLERGEFFDCEIKHNVSFGISGGRRFENCRLQFDKLPILGGDGVDEDVLINSRIELKDIGFTFSAGKGENTVYENFTPSIYKPEGNLGFGFGLDVEGSQCSKNTYRNIKANDGFFGLRGTYRDCLFENIEIDHMHLDWAVFENCKFKNFKLNTTIFVEDAKFINTTCENCIIAPGIEIIQDAKRIESYPGLPFEIPRP